MKARFVVLLVVICCVVTVYLLTSTNNTLPPGSTDAATMPVKEALTELMAQENQKDWSDEEKLEKYFEVLDMLPPEYDRIKHQYKIAMSFLPDYTLFGRVVDQHGEPVENALIKYTGQNKFLSSGTGRSAIYTDQDGRFEINASGKSLVLSGIVHPDIEYSYPLKFNDRVENATYSQLNLEAKFAKTDNRAIYFDIREYSENYPFVVRVWRKGAYEGAVSGQYRAALHHDGSIATVRFSNKWGAKQIFEEGVGGHLRLSCQRGEQEHLRDYSDWSITIAPVNGGILETDDLYMNLAPESGYGPSYTIQMRIGNKSYKPRVLNKRFFFRSNDGKEYGSLYVHFTPHDAWRRNVQRERDCYVDISYKLNPNGSRNLELKQNNALQPPVRSVDNKLASLR
jgi:hypothetical protein